MKNVLFFTRAMDIGGTEKIILQMCNLLQHNFDKIVVVSSGGKNEDTLNKLNIKHYKIPDIDKKNLKVFFIVLKTISEIIKKENITIVHTHHRMAAFYTRIISIFKKFIFVHTAHNTFTDKRLFTRFALKKCKIIAVGEVVKTNLSDYYGLDANNITVIHNAIEEDKNKITPIDEIQLARKQKYYCVGNVGRLAKQKGMGYFVNAIPYILKENKKAKFFIIGDGEENERLHQLVLELGLKDDVFFLGYRSDVINVMKQLDLIVLSSLWEGLPLTPIEAFSVHKTVIATDVDGTREIVRHGVNGLLIEPKDSLAIAKAVCLLIDNFLVRQELQENANKTYNDNFTIPNFIKKYSDFYTSLL